MNSTTQAIKKILIANRGEIALRVISTCRLMGIKTVTLFSNEEASLPHALLADESVCLGEGALSETYLNIDKIVQIALNHDVDAIHPGYGFLSENANFSKKVKEAGLVFIGPKPETMTLMGDKIQSKKAMEKLGIPIIPGYHGDNQDDAFLKSKALEVGYPILIKATAGGGGKGMRVVEEESTFIESLLSARREAKKSFGNDKVLIEKFITNPRHIEVQVLSSLHKEHLHLFERECSIQRRHQKIIEESPSVALSKVLREKICSVATQITEGIQYEGAGTIEYILDKDGHFYFLEMNTRLQVEHPITEMVTGIDLVRAQIDVAEGKAFSFKQEDIKQKGHSIEVRIYAENPDKDFLPSTGRIEYVGNPEGNGIRFDCGYHDGNEVTINFDPMLAKLICWAPDRDQAIHKMNTSLDDVLFLGIKTNREYLKRVLGLPHFLRGETYTHFISLHSEELKKEEESDEELALVLAGHLLESNLQSYSESKTQQDSLGISSWEYLTHFRNA